MIAATDIISLQYTKTKVGKIINPLLVDSMLLDYINNSLILQILRMDVSILDEQQQDDGDQSFIKNKTFLLAGVTGARVAFS